MKPRANARQQRRAEQAEPNLWCSWGRHHTYRYPVVKEHYRAGTICLGCQVEIMGNLEKAVFMPELSEAMRILARKRWDEARARAVAEAPLRADSPDLEGVVYYIRINGQVKIGYTTNLTRRSRNYPPGSELLAVEPGSREVEAQRHRQFARALARGREWFHESAELEQHMYELTQKFGRPEVLMYKYTPRVAARKVEDG